MTNTGFGGQSAPPSLKLVFGLAGYFEVCWFRGAVRPPFIEAFGLSAI